MSEDNVSVEAEQIDAAPKVEAEATQVDEAPQQKQEKNWRKLEEERDYYRNMYEQNARSQPQQQVPQQDSFDLNNVRDDDIPTYGDLKKVLNREAQEKSYLYNKINELELRSKYSDVDDVINQYLPDALKDEPDLEQAVKSNPQLKRLAYKLAQSSPKYHQERLAKSNQSAINKIVENSTRPQPASSRKNVAVQNEEARYSNMSDEDILKNFNMAKARY